ncbi:PAS domain S-box protein [Gramella jeungdoensis]|uniref:histidine kinase n=1 Tax=Gramella jeungdoensis TaxID=708091 RepID=A0ABT0Z043_9FLAO|nr:PAS domain S-box protein [Gramella jeungdoensis]MCM8568765.1 PAS domain S-box protein [Gramella jeungdoensis]
MAQTIKNPNTISKRKPFLIGLLAFLFLLLIGFFMLWQRYQILEESRQSEMEGIIDVVEQNIDQSLKYSYSAALSLALQIDNDGKIDNFDEVAPQLVDNNPNIDAIEIVPDGIITKVYPYEENKAAINYNILQDSTRNEEAFKAIERRRMFFGGPFELKQGGVAIVGRLPVFIKNEFWGFVAVLIDFDNLIHQSGIRELSGERYKFQFSKVNPVTNKEEFFLKGVSGVDGSYSEHITLPDGDWKIYIIPLDPYQPLYAVVPVAFLILILSGAFGWIIYNAMKQPLILEARVKEQAGELAKSELRFRTIFNQAAIGMARVNSKTGMIQQTNKRFQELLGYSEEELKTMDYKDVSHPDDLVENTELMRKLRNNSIREYSLEKRLERKNGTNVWVRLNVSALWEEGQPATSHIALVEDISARVKAKQELIENEKRFRSLVENSNEVILIINKEGEAVYCSPSLKRITGYDELLCSGNDIFSLIHAEERNLLLEKLKCANANPGKAYAEIVMRVKTSNSHWIWVNATLTNLLNEKNVEGYVVNLRDVTAKKEAELNLVKSYELVMEQNKRLLNFAYIVSHNLRSHSSNLESILDLYDTEDSEEEKQNYMRLLKNVSENLNQSLHDLNEVVSINTNLDISLEPISVSDYVDKTIELLGLQIKSKEAKVCKKVPAEMVVSFNSAYMESVLLNFLTNALRYSHPERQPYIKIRGYKEGFNWILEVEDNGIGIDLEKHGDKVFGLYKTFSGRQDARGVGLFITKNQVNAMGGSVEVTSEPDVGTTFKVVFK